MVKLQGNLRWSPASRYAPKSEMRLPPTSSHTSPVNADNGCRSVTALPPSTSSRSPAPGRFCPRHCRRSAAPGGPPKRSDGATFARRVVSIASDATDGQPSHARRTTAALYARRPLARLQPNDAPRGMEFVKDWGGDHLAKDRRWQIRSRRKAMPTSPDCSTSSITLRRRGPPVPCSPTARYPRTSRATARSSDATSSKPAGGPHGPLAQPTVLLHTDPGMPLVPRPQPRRPQAAGPARRGANRRCP